MAPDLHHASRDERIIDMGLHLAIDGDTAMGQNGLGLVAADAVKGPHNKVEQRAGLFHLASDGLVATARHSMVMTSVGHAVEVLLYRLFLF